MSPFEGKLAFWNSARGFGFIRPKQGGKDVFIHVRDLRHKSQVPQIGEIIFYDIKQGHDGRARAYNAYVNGASSVKFKGGVLFVLLLFIIIATPFALSLYIMNITWYPFVIYAVVSILCFSAYSIDKGKAASGSWRTSEATLHLLELFGGWPGALVAQQTLRHKTKKLSFQFGFWVIVLLHFIVWIGYLVLH